MTLGYGFLAMNGSAKVLIDSRAKNLFFLNKATYNRIVSTEIYAGGSVVLAYRATCPTGRTPVPFFTQPYNDRYVGTISINPVSTNIWEIRLLVSGTSTSILPEVYIFIEHDKILSPLGKYGLVVYKQGTTSEVTFDSRLKPLIIHNTVAVTPPANPYTRTDDEMCSGNRGAAAGPFQRPDLGVGPCMYLEIGSIAEGGTVSAQFPYGTGAGTHQALTDGRLVPDNYSDYPGYPFSAILGHLGKPIYYYSSAAQAYKQYKARENLRYNYDSGYWQETVEKWACTNYATFSRTGIRLSWDGLSYKIRIGWTVVEAATKGPVVGDSGPEDGFVREELRGRVGIAQRLANTNDLYALVGTDLGASGTYGIGTWAPAQSINLQETNVIIADGSKYD